MQRGVLKDGYTGLSTIIYKIWFLHSEMDHYNGNCEALSENIDIRI